jgi:hypothetical protein
MHTPVMTKLLLFRGLQEGAARAAAGGAPVWRHAAHPGQQAGHTSSTVTAGDRAGACCGRLLGATSAESAAVPSCGSQSAAKQGAPALLTVRPCMLACQWCIDAGHVLLKLLLHTLLLMLRLCVIQLKPSATRRPAALPNMPAGA